MSPVNGGATGGRLNPTASNSRAPTVRQPSVYRASPASRDRGCCRACPTLTVVRASRASTWPRGFQRRRPGFQGWWAGLTARRAMECDAARRQPAPLVGSANTGGLERPADPGSSAPVPGTTRSSDVAATPAAGARHAGQPPL